MAAGLRFHTQAGLLTSFIAALPFPVSQWIAGPLPYTVTASFRIRTGFPFHLLLGRHLCATTLYFSDSGIISHFVELSIRSDGGSLKSIDSCMPDLLLSQCILPTVSARSREAPCRLSAPALAYLFRVFSSLSSRSVIFRRLMPRVDPLCSSAEVAGGSTPATPSAISVRLKPTMKR